MSRICAVCDKRPRSSMSVSKAHNRVKRWLYPNVHTTRFTLKSDPKGRVHRAKVCTKCVKAGKIQKVI